MKRTKILATYGPSVSPARTLKKLIASGVDAVRINCSHGDAADFEAAANAVREAANQAKRRIGILFDISGPKLRLERFEGELPIRKGARLTLTRGKSNPAEMVLGVNHPAIIKSVKKGERLMIDDGQLLFDIEEANGSEVQLIARNGGVISSAKGINLPDSMLAIPTLGQKDRQDIKTAVALHADFIAISFVRSPEDMNQARRLLKKLGGKQMLIAKLEKPEAIAQLEDVMQASDGVMIARGDLGVEMPPAEVPLIQKRIIRLARLHHKPVIVATQMLESMRHAPRATRAEVNDVASAVYDAVDAVMLSGETASGEYPLEAVKTMRDVIVTTETECLDPSKCGISTPMSTGEHTIPYTIARAVHESDRHCRATLICAFTTSGFTARLIASLRPTQSILALSPSDTVCRQLSLLWSVFAVKVEQPGSFEDMLTLVNKHCRQFKLAHPGDVVIITGGAPFGFQVPTNFMHVHEVV